MDKIVAIGLMLISTLISSIGALFLKLGVNKTKKLSKIKDYVRLVFSRNVILGVLFYFLGTMMFVWILTSNELSYLYPLTALAYFFIIFLSIRFLNEKMNKYKWLGVLLIVIGVLILSL